MKMTILMLFILLVLGFLFVKWANKPENVAAIQNERKEKALEKAEIERQKTLQLKDFDAKKAMMKLVIDEDFTKKAFQFLDFRPELLNLVEFKDKMAEYATLTTRGQNASSFFIFSKEDYEDFIIEIEMEIWGYGACGGIVWDAELDHNNNPINFETAYSSPSSLYVRTTKSKSFMLSGILLDENKQVIRAERIGNHLKISVNGISQFGENVEIIGKGKVGIYLGHGGGGDYPETIKVNIKSFKVFR
jgi:hypothetical protein